MSAGDFFRGGGLWLSRTLLVTLLISLVIFLGLSNITDSSFLKPLSGQLIGSYVQNMPLDEQYNSLRSQCNLQKKENISIPLSIGPENFTLDINCDSLKNGGKEGLVNSLKTQFSDKLFNKVYYKKVCSGYTCLSVIKSLKNPLDLLSEDFNKFLKSQVNILIGLSVLFMILIVILARGISSKLTSLGGSLFTAGLPYFGIKILEKKMVSVIPNGKGFLPIVQTIMAPLGDIFLWIMIIGGIVLLSGIGIKLYLKIKEKRKKETKKK